MRKNALVDQRSHWPRETQRRYSAALSASIFQNLGFICHREARLAQVLSEHRPRHLSSPRNEDHDKVGLGNAKDYAADDLIWQLTPFRRGLLQRMHGTGMTKKPIGDIHPIQGAPSGRKFTRRQIHHF